MPKYRLLNTSELSELEGEFIKFLVLNGITAPDWEVMKQNAPHSVERMIDFFSDVVFESILRKINFLEHRTTHQLHVFQCLPDQLVLVAMEAMPAEEVDFTNAAFVSSSMLTPPEKIQVYTTTKPYATTREAELFEMLERGCFITDGKLFKALCLAL